MHAPGICAEVELEGKGYSHADGDTAGTEYDTREVPSSDESYVSGGFRAKNREFIDSRKSGQQPGSNFADGVKTMRVAEEILAQALIGGQRTAKLSGWNGVTIVSGAWGNGPRPPEGLHSLAVAEYVCGALQPTELDRGELIAWRGQSSGVTLCWVGRSQAREPAN